MTRTDRPARLALAAALFAAFAAEAAPLEPPFLAPGQDIRREQGEIVVPGFGSPVAVVRYTWRDSGGNPRSVSLVPASPATSGYAVQMTYTVPDGGGRNVYVNTTPAADGGFGYFVSHELYRQFTGGGEGTIAALHAEDDSPLGRYLPSTGSAYSVTQTQAAQEFRLDYPRWGTVAAMPDPLAGPTSPDLAQHQKFLLPVVIRWHFVAGRDYPLWSVEYDQSAASDHVAHDVRGPYGVMEFNEAAGPLVTALRWGDKYHFAADAGALDFGGAALGPNGVSWTWNAPNAGRRYNALSAGSYEFGLVDTAPYAASRYGSGYANGRGSTKAVQGGCGYGLLSMPCDWEWAYQSFQYDYGPPARPKIAWGSSPYLGTSLTQVYVNGTEPETIVPQGRIHYGVHVVMGRGGTGAPLSLARAAAAAEPAPALSVSAQPAAGGAVSYSVLGDATGPHADAGRTLAPWASVRLTATPAGGYAFSGWGGACAGEASATCLVTMDQSRAVTASFSAGGGAGDTDGDGIPDAVEGPEGRNPLVKDNDLFSPGAGSARLFAMQQYRDFLGREGDSAGIQGWTDLVTAGTYTRPQVIDAFVQSQEFSGFVAPVVRLYFATFLRVPDYAGLVGNAALVRNGTVTLVQLADFFAASPEFAATYGALDNTQFVTLLYNNVLQRAPDAGGLAGWVGLLNGGMSRGQVLLGFSDSTEYQGAMASEVLVTMMYAAMLRRTPEPAGFNGWVGFLDNATYTREQVINGFFLSAEYRARFLP